jgi:hypothetical protein
MGERKFRSDVILEGVNPEGEWGIRGTAPLILKLDLWR